MARHATHIASRPLGDGINGHIPPDSVASVSSATVPIMAAHSGVAEQSSGAGAVNTRFSDVLEVSWGLPSQARCGAAVRWVLRSTPRVSWRRMMVSLHLRVLCCSRHPLGLRRSPTPGGAEEVDEQRP